VRNLPDIDHIIDVLLTRQQKAEIARMMSSGNSRTDAIRRLLRLGTLVRATWGLEEDLLHGSDYVLKRKTDE